MSEINAGSYIKIEVLQTRWRIKKLWPFQIRRDRSEKELQRTQAEWKYHKMTQRMSRMK